MRSLKMTWEYETEFDVRSHEAVSNKLLCLLVILDMVIQKMVKTVDVNFIFLCKIHPSNMYNCWNIQCLSF